MSTASFARKIGSDIAKSPRNGVSGWYSHHMAAASRAIAERIPLVDLVLDVRDARIPISSEYEELRKYRSSSRRIVVLNKADLANRSQTKEWMSYFEQNNCVSYKVNAHNNDNIQQFLNFLQSRVRELRKKDNSFTTTVLLVGIPNVGKSALANALHKIGRISASEKGKLKNAIVSPNPCETKDITSFKIGSHPNIYVLDTPGVLPPEIYDFEVCSKLALTGAINNDLVEVKELARYFLSILNSSDEYKKWSELPHDDIDRDTTGHSAECLRGVEKRRRKQYPSDHTQDFMVKAVRKTLFESISSFDGDVDINEEDGSKRLIESEIVAVKRAFRIGVDPSEDIHFKVASKLLNLYRTGRLGHYTLDSVPRNTKNYS